MQIWLYMKSWIKKIYKIIIAIFFVGLCSVPFIWNDCFFGTETTIADTLKYVGAFIGGILLAVNAYFIYRRTEEQSKSNNLTIKGQELIAKGQLDTRFKDAATLLATGNTSAELSVIHALHQIAIEASKTKDQKDYVGVIKDILIAFIRENSNIEEETNAKSNIVLQTIIDKLFRDKCCEIYAEYRTDLSNTVLKGMDFFYAQLQKVKFSNVKLQGANFGGAQLQKAYFWTVQLQKVNFGGTELQGAYFANSQMQTADFAGSQLQGSIFADVQLQNAYFGEAQLQKTYFDKVQLQGARFGYAYDIDKAFFSNTFWDEKTNFEGTAFENKTIKALTEIMGNPPTLLGK